MARPGLRYWGAALPAFCLISAAAAPSPAVAASTVETVSFAGKSPVKIVRGSADRRPAVPDNVEIVSFGAQVPGTVRVMRGAHRSGPADGMTAGGALRTIETISFGDSRQPQVTIVRGAASLSRASALDLFGSAPNGDLERIAFAVDGIESNHGGDLRMWRNELSGPQGPMQVSEAAAIDVGGGNRFDEHENRVLGRAYIARMYARYGNWPDAIAAYNWGPGNLDLWIGAGRPTTRLPLDVERYVERVLRDAVAGAAPLLDTLPSARPARSAARLAFPHSRMSIK